MDRSFSKNFSRLELDTDLRDQTLDLVKEALQEGISDILCH